MINIIWLYNLYVNLFLIKKIKIKEFKKNKNIPLIIEAINEKKGTNIKVISLEKINNSPSSLFIVCTGNSNIHINAIANSIKKKLLGMNHNDEGKTTNWRLLDYMNIVVHILTKENRLFYGLEDLWKDGMITNLDDINDNEH